MISESVVDLSRLQFAITAMYHVIFVPLTLGLAFLLAIMESVYVMTGKQVYKDMVKFWGKLFGINRACTTAQATPCKSTIPPCVGLFFLFWSFTSFASAQIYPVNQLKQDIASFLATKSTIASLNWPTSP